MLLAFSHPHRDVEFMFILGTHEILFLFGTPVEENDRSGKVLPTVVIQAIFLTYCRINYARFNQSDQVGH